MLNPTTGGMLCVRIQYDLHNMDIIFYFIVYLYIFTVRGYTGAQTTEAGSLALSVL